MLEQIALGEMGYKENYFYSLTPRTFMNAVIGFRKRDEDNYRASASQTRMFMWAALAPYQKKGSDFTPEKLLPFPWEKPAQDALPELTPEQLSAAALQMQEFWDNADTKLAQDPQPVQKLSMAQLLREQTS